MGGGHNLHDMGRCLSKRHLRKLQVGAGPPRMGIDFHTVCFLLFCFPHRSANVKRKLIRSNREGNTLGCVCLSEEGGLKCLLADRNQIRSLVLTR